MPASEYVTASTDLITSETPEVPVPENLDCNEEDGDDEVLKNITIRARDSGGA